VVGDGVDIATHNKRLRPGGNCFLAAADRHAHFCEVGPGKTPGYILPVISQDAAVVESAV